jgi:hypothetical protein
VSYSVVTGQNGDSKTQRMIGSSTLLMGFLPEHDLIRKPGPTFRDHALTLP